MKRFAISIAMICLIGVILVVLIEWKMEKNRNSSGLTERKPQVVNQQVPMLEEPIYKFSLAHSSFEDSETHKFAVDFADRVAAKSGRKIKIILFPNGQLGNDQELLEGVQRGNISIVAMSSSSQINCIPEATVFDMPFIFEDFAQSVKVYDEEFRIFMNRFYNKAGLQLVALDAGGFRKVSIDRPIRVLEDFRGINIRTLENQYQIGFWQLFDSKTTPMPFKDLYIALQQKVVQAQENTISAIYSSSVYEFQKYIVNTNHSMMVRTVVMNKEIYEKMSSEDQEIILVAARESAQMIDAGHQKSETEISKLLMQRGVEFIKLSDGMREQMKEKSKPIYDSISQIAGERTIEVLREKIRTSQ